MGLRLQGGRRRGRGPSAACSLPCGAAQRSCACAGPPPRAGQQLRPVPPSRNCPRGHSSHGPGPAVAMQPSRNLPAEHVTHGAHPSTRVPTDVAKVLAAQSWQAPASWPAQPTLCLPGGHVHSSHLPARGPPHPGKSHWHTCQLLRTRCVVLEGNVTQTTNTNKNLRTAFVTQNICMHATAAHYYCAHLPDTVPAGMCCTPRTFPA